MNFLIDLIKGIFVGVANVIPGVSGGTMAVSFGIYDKLLSSISNLIKDFKKSFRTLLPIALGMIIGIVGFTFIVPLLLETQPFITSLAFTGLIMGGLPMIIHSLKKGWEADTKKSLPVNVIILVLFTAIAVVMPFMNGDSESGVLLTAKPSTMIIVFFIGAIAAAAMIIPGVSGSLLLMILGYYFGIISAVKDFISGLKDFNMSVLIDRALILAPFALGCLIGVFFIAKLISWLLKNYSSATFCGILGLIIASPVSIFYKVNQEYDMTGTTIVQIIIGILVFAGCTYLTLAMGKLDTKKEM